MIYEQIDEEVVGSTFLNVLDRLAFDVLAETASISTENICKLYKCIRNAVSMQCS